MFIITKLVSFLFGAVLTLLHN